MIPIFKAIILVVLVTLAVAGLLNAVKTPERVTAGTLRNTSLYIPMSDGVRIAVDVALPRDLKPGQHALTGSACEEPKTTRWRWLAPNGVDRPDAD